MERLLSKALDDALVPEEDEILPLHDISKDRVYTFDGVNYVKAVTWIDNTYLQNWKDALKKSDKQYTLPFSVPIWLTIVPQMQDFCSSTFFQSEKDMELRLKQKLGLNYKKIYSHFVEVYVPLSHLRRPCMNPDVGFTTCPPCAAETGSDSQARLYYKWRQNINGEVEFPVPFTGLGYTYDWGPGDSEVGFSEFVFISDGVTPLLVESVNTTLDYCTK
ncbi:MAG: hypothetical protein R8G66_01745 [Cytophagales bacterium]|nr:hypothetical protein [Cytophagales bacterium]